MPFTTAQLAVLSLIAIRIAQAKGLLTQTLYHQLLNELDAIPAKIEIMFERHRYPRVIILQAVYFKLRFTLSYRDVEELMSIRVI